MDLPGTFQPSEPFAVFQSLLDDFPQLLDKAHHLRTTNADDPISLKAAVIGFGLFHPMQAWSRANFEYIDSHLNGEVPPDNFSPTPDCDEAIRAFASLGLGASLGLFNAGHIDDDQATKNEWYLYAFINVHGQQICERYQAAEQSWNGGSS
jgi:hypothetical protein